MEAKLVTVWEVNVTLISLVDSLGVSSSKTSLWSRASTYGSHTCFFSAVWVGQVNSRAKKRSMRAAD